MWKRIIAPAVVVSVCWVTVGLTTSIYLYSQGRDLDRVLVENVSSIVACTEMKEIAWQMQTSVVQAAADSSSVENRSLDELVQRFDQLQHTAEASALLPEEMPLLNRVHGQFAEYTNRCRQATETKSRDEAILAELRPMVSRLTELCQQVVEVNERAIRDAAYRRRHLTTWIVIGRTAMLFVGPGLGLLMGFRLARQLNQSIAKINVSLQALAGDVEQEVGQWEITPDADLPAIQQKLDVITERMRGVVQELHKSRHETMRAERLAAVGELAAGVAHELRNPLTSVKLLIQTMQHRHRQTIPRETFDVVLEEIGRMETTIQGLLDFARPPVLQTAVQDLRQIVQRAVNLTDGKARQSEVSISLHFPDGPVWVNVDAGQLHQVCVNILLNGLESMSAGGVFDIHVQSDPAAGIARIRFDDSGAGIPDTIMPRLFEPFVTSKDYGTGLGLAVSRRIILNHSGRLFAENRSDGGASLTIELALDHVPAHQEMSHAHALAD